MLLGDRETSWEGCVQPNSEHISSLSHDQVAGAQNPVVQPTKSKIYWGPSIVGLGWKSLFVISLLRTT